MNIKSFNQLRVFLFLLSIFIVGRSNGQVNSSQISSQTKSYFDGVYLKAAVGSQNIFGGAFIDNLDLLAQKSGFVFELSPGYRKQFLQNRLVVGLEILLGFTDGDLVEFDERYQYDVFYKNNFQRAFGLITGVTVGSKKNFLILGYANAMNRKFDIEIVDTSGAVFTQQDGQGFLQYGVAVEVNLNKMIHTRASLGGVYTDYGDLITSQAVDDKLDFNLGIIYQL